MCKSPGIYSGLFCILKIHLLERSMEKEIQFFIPCKDVWRDGSFIPVRCRFNQKIEREFLPSELKEAFLKNWGERIIYDDEFVDWYTEERKKESDLRMKRIAREEDNQF